MQTDFARALCSVVKSGTHSDTDRSAIFSKYLQDFTKIEFNRAPSAGFISLILEEGGFGEFWYGFTTPTMGLGFMSSNDDRPTSFIDRLPSGSRFRLSGMPF
jgi:hypothetical protein